jgi:hypothetical protein
VHSKTGCEVRADSYKLLGVDRTQVPGLAKNVLVLFTEVGRDMSRRATAAHVVSWLALCPDNDIRGGKVLWRGMRHRHHRAGQRFRLAAHALHHHQTPRGNYLRRRNSKLGPQGPTTATAQKIAIIFYTMVKNQVEYDATRWGQRTYSARNDSRKNSNAKPGNSAPTRFPRRKASCVTD